MALFKSPIIARERVFRWLIIFGVIVGIGILGYFGLRVIRVGSDILQRLPAALLEPTEEPIVEEIFEEVAEGTAQEPIETQEEEKKYTETAKEGEGITHLARKILRTYLQEKEQSFAATPEHKIFIEDYIAKKMGSGWLKLGEQLEISENLVKEALEKAENLTPEQLENLTQYSQLVPSLNY